MFKTAKVIPIHKSGNKQLVQNYCPLSLLSCLSKIQEKVLKNRLITFFSKHKIIYDNQYGFREKHSVIHAFLDVLLFCYDAIQKKHHSALLLMDLKKAFDTVSHEILLNKLCLYSIRGPAYDLIEGYLSNRNQFVSIINHCSSSKPINIGVLHGSILGLYFFLFMSMTYQMLYLAILGFLLMIGASY